MLDFSACIIIPNYNHSAGFESIIDKLVSLKLPIIIVDDGSNDTTSKLLDDISQGNEDVTLISFAHNRGKGYAVQEGILYAEKKGFTHAFQIDADGQHNLEDVEKFLRISQEFPQAVINGQPIFDDSIPLGRRLAKNITHFWVWVETLSFSIKDSMCGFRIYPIAITAKIFKNYKVGERMDFDSDILVRLYWEHIEIHSPATKVIYPEGGLSNFRLWQDNWLITKMHTRLFFGMLKRFPNLIKYNPQQPKQDHWDEVKERGSASGISFLFWIYRLFGRSVFLLILHPVTVYFFLTGKTARKASRQYLQQLADFQGKNNITIGWQDIYFHFFQFGVSAIDKIGSWSGEIQRDDVVIHGFEAFDELVESGRGAVFMGSHLGNMELCRALGHKEGRLKINALVFNKHALNFQKVLSSSDTNVEFNLIHVEAIGIDTAIILQQKIDNGEAVVLFADRTSAGSVEKVQEANFLGKPASFAEGPFILAGLLKCPVYLLFCIREQGIYHVYFENFASTLSYPRKLRKKLLQANIQKYADRLSYYCGKAPDQWFNFYDYWASGQPDKKERDQS